MNEIRKVNLNVRYKYEWAITIGSEKISSQNPNTISVYVYAFKFFSEGCYTN